MLGCLLDVTWDCICSLSMLNHQITAAGNAEVAAHAADTGCLVEAEAGANLEATLLSQELVTRPRKFCFVFV